jgi:hypothetical protein
MSKGDRETVAVVITGGPGLESCALDVELVDGLHALR